MSDRHFFRGLATGFSVGGENIVHGRKPGARGAGEDGLDDLGDAEEWKAVVEESGHGYLIGGVEGAGQCPTLLHRFARKTQTRKTPRGSFREIQTAEFRPIKGHLIGCDTGRIG